MQLGLSYANFLSCKIRAASAQKDSAKNSVKKSAKYNCEASQC
ncbi:hypothetical protein GPAL_1082 [Glaciecola pallidula DSM 14239 = ACAM 615]|uniref:Uncharacterized protein n=1 Tax=Brumicola pallidula DSM 14239 = ACAM 615 TaxID=1121922 RepID=K6YVF3_9ALTE|nr:hypothetical protein GPAL_1082 [Glaciecola pallidula DSM 14239 = ACAM 615]